MERWRLFFDAAAGLAAASGGRRLKPAKAPPFPLPTDIKHQQSVHDADSD